MELFVIQNILTETRQKREKICKQILFILKIRTAQRSSYSSTTRRKLGRGALNIISEVRYESKYEVETDVF